MAGYYKGDYMDNGYSIIDDYRKARRLTWPRLYREMKLRDISMNTIYVLVKNPDRVPIPMVARKLDGWIAKNREEIEAAINRVKP